MKDKRKEKLISKFLRHKKKADDAQKHADKAQHYLNLILEEYIDG